MSKESYFPELTGIRAIAAYLVFFFHYSNTFIGNVPSFLIRFINKFHIGVPIFFVLSGFLICFRNYNNENYNSSWYLNYIKKRFARIYPIYFLLTLAVFAYYFLSKDETITQNHKNPILILFFNLTFLRGFFTQLWNTGIPQGWSLTVEECFYLTAPLILIVIKKYNKIFLLPIVITLIGISLVVIFSHFNFYGFFGTINFMLTCTFFGRCFEFIVGIFLARHLLINGFVRTKKINFTLLGCLLIFISLVVLMLQAKLNPGKFITQTIIGVITNNYILSTSIAILFFGLLTEATLVKKILSNKIVVLLGKSSYVFYLIHLGWIYNSIIYIFDKINIQILNYYKMNDLHFKSPFGNHLINLFYAFILLNLLSILLFKYIEQPINNYIRKSNLFVKKTIQ